jgi:type III restriction enzyme
MTSLALKQYQDDALAALGAFLADTRKKPLADAFKAVLVGQNRSETYQPLFGDEVPCVCLRVPTGGGKTLLAAHAVALAGRAILDTDAPVALWLTPSDAIRTQTLEGLSNAHHPYRKALDQHFGDRVRVCDLESLQTISARDVGKSCVVVVATIQSFNVRSTGIRNVYSFFEELAPHFTDLPANACEGLEKVTAEDLQNQPFLTPTDLGRVKYSVANWLHRQRPVIIVDEAHNNRTHTFFTSLGRLNPSCVVELTATPVPGNNVLYHVSAAELKAEEMIKLPIVLAEHPDGWQACLQDALLTRTNLETVAQKEPDYVRPIVLIQAEPKGGEATVDVVRQHLQEELNISKDQIKVATGTQKELGGIDLFDPACPVRYVVTVEALKEGWDCSFAYVLASLQSVKSAKDVEQLLGRVLRMPYAKSRQQEPLNKAYAHIVAANFAEAASNLKDRMVQNMGFEPLEASAVLLPAQQPLALTGGAAVASTRLPDCHIQLDQVPDTQHWPEDVKQAVDIRPTSQGATVLVKGNVDADTLKQAETFITQAVAPKQRESVQQQFAAHHALRRALQAPAQLGASFAPIPQLCLNLEGYLEVVERETLSNLGDWDLLDSPIALPGFAIHESVNSFEIDVNGERVKYRHIDSQQLNLNAIGTTVSEQDLVRWLDGQTRKPYLMQAQLRAYLVKMVTHLTKERGFTLTALVRARHLLAQAIGVEIIRLRQAAIAKGFGSQLPLMVLAPPEQQAIYSFQYQPGQYPARNIYQGSYEFSKHFYPVIHDLREKTAAGQQTEEFVCAQAIDAHPKVKHWVRNIQQQEKFSFWLPTATDYFYPDFVAELTDGRLLVVEYKGDGYVTNDDSREKKQVGYQWEQSSSGRCLFLFAVADDNGRAVSKQIADKIG